MTPWSFFVAARYSTVSGELLSETYFYTIVPAHHLDDVEGYAHRFFEGYAALPPDVELVVREVTRAHFNKHHMTLP